MRVVSEGTCRWGNHSRSGSGSGTGTKFERAAESGFGLIAGDDGTLTLSLQTCCFETLLSAAAYICPLGMSVLASCISAA